MPDDAVSRTKPEPSPSSKLSGPMAGLEAGPCQRQTNGLLEASPGVANRLRARACYGEAMAIRPGVQAVLANNAKDYTGPGTNTYIVGEERLWIIDPGPDCDHHMAAVERVVADRPIEGILVTHTHLDHSPAARPMGHRFAAPILSGPALDANIIQQTGEEVDPNYCPDRVLKDGETLGEGLYALTALSTPGHFPNHFVYHMPALDILFSGDHVMGWSTTVVVPPLGNLADYLTSVDRMEALKPRLMLPSHGPAIDDPAGRLADIRQHRAKRHAQICACLDSGITDPQAIVEQIYEGLTPTLKKAAAGQVAAHIELQDSGRLDLLPAL